MAGDFDLWKRFARLAKSLSKSVNLNFACHRKSENKLKNLDTYYKEIGKKKCLFNLLYPLRIILSFINKFLAPKIK